MKTRMLCATVAATAIFASISMSAAADDVVRIAALPYMSQGIISIGIAEGYFENEGITVETIEMRGSGPILPGLLSGDIDLALAIPGPGLFNAIARGGGLRIVAPGVTFSTEQCDYVVMYSRNGYNRAEVAAMEGKDVKTSAIADSFQEYTAHRLNDLPDQGTISFEFTFVPPHSAADAMNNGALDMTLTAEPWITRLNAGGVGQVFASLSEIMPDQQLTYLLFSKRLLEENPDLGMRARRAMDAAIKTYNEGKTDRNVEILAEYTGLEPDLIKQACWAYVPVDGDVNMPAIDAYQAWLNDRGLLDEVLPADRILATFPTK